MVSVKRRSFVLEIAAVTSLVFMAITVTLLLFPSLKNSELSAMIQAIGSLLALFVAIFVMWWQGERIADATRTEISRRLAVTEALVERGYQMSLLIDKHTQPIDNFLDYCFAVVDPINIESTLISLKSLPLHTLDSYEIVIGVQNMVVWLEKLDPLIAIHLSKKDVHYIFEGDDLLTAKLICKKIKAARDLVKKSILELGYTHHNIHPLTML